MLGIVNSILNSERSAIALATPLDSGTRGTPAPGTTRLLLHENGKILGTVGGGSMESSVMERMSCLKSTTSVSFELSDAKSGGAFLCGGKTTFFLEPLVKARKGPFEVMKSMLENDKFGVEAILLEEGLPYSQRLVSSGELNGSSIENERLQELILERISSFIDSSTTHIHEFDVHGEKKRVLFVPVEPNPILHIFGGGHVGLYTAQIAKIAGFDIHVYDDRDEFVAPERFPFATKTRKLDLTNIGEEEGIDVGEKSYIVIMTRGHSFDYEVLQFALTTNAKYIGMIGSRTKTASIFSKLRRQGYTDEQIQSIFAPIGLRIGADTPQEVALSVVAELVQVRRDKLNPKGRSKPLNMKI